jgi:hypothetical protein
MHHVHLRSYSARIGPPGPPWTRVLMHNSVGRRRGGQAVQARSTLWAQMSAASAAETPGSAEAEQSDRLIVTQ